MRRDAAHVKVELLNDNKEKSVTALFQGGRSKGYVRTAQLSEKESVFGVVKTAGSEKTYSECNFLDYFFCFAKHKLGVMWSLPQE
jgi:hypothetical protein